jgi:hypothetical protein
VCTIGEREREKKKIVNVFGREISLSLSLSFLLLLSFFFLHNVCACSLTRLTRHILYIRPSLEREREMEDFLNSMKGQVPMLRMLSHMGVQDNSTQTNLRQQFVDKHIQDVNEIEKRVSVRFCNISSSAAAIIVMILRSQSFNHYHF